MAQGWKTSYMNNIATVLEEAILLLGKNVDSHWPRLPLLLEPMIAKPVISLNRFLSLKNYNLSLGGKWTTLGSFYSGKYFISITDT